MCIASLSSKRLRAYYYQFVPSNKRVRELNKVPCFVSLFDLCLDSPLSGGRYIVRSFLVPGGPRVYLATFGCPSLLPLTQAPSCRFQVRLQVVAVSRYLGDTDSLREPGSEWLMNFVHSQCTCLNHIGSTFLLLRQVAGLGKVYFPPHSLAFPEDNIHSLSVLDGEWLLPNVAARRGW